MNINGINIKNNVFVRLVNFSYKIEKKNAIRLFCALLFLIGMISTGTFLPFLLKKLVTVMDKDPVNINKCLFIFFAYSILWLLKHILPSFQRYFMFKVIEGSTQYLNISLMDHLNKLPMAFHTSKKTGELVSFLDRTQLGVANIINGILFVVLPTIIEILILSFVFWRMYSYIYAVAIFFVVSMLFFFNRKAIEITTKARREANQAHRRALNIFFENTVNFEAIRYFGTQEYEISRYKEALNLKKTFELRSNILMEKFNLFQDLILGIGFIVVNLIIIIQIHRHAFDVGDFFFVNSFMMQVFIPLRSFGATFRGLKRSFVDVEYILDLLSLKTEYKLSDEKHSKTPQGSEIIFKNINFGYSTTSPVLKKVSFKAVAGKKLAIVGSTGEGKSTITKLLLKFYRPFSGEITIGGVNLNELTTNQLASMFGVVSQDITLFNDSIFYNITYGSPLCNKEEVERVIESVGLKSKIESLPQGYNTIIGERGIKLSGGEKQKIAFARVLLRDPQIYIFDEATSSLDMKTEVEIMGLIKKLTRSKTSVIISHRLFPIKDANMIIVLKNGRIVEAGKHKELLKIGGEYERLWKLQCKPLRKGPVSNSR